MKVFRQTSLLCPRRFVRLGVYPLLLGMQFLSPSCSPKVVERYVTITETVTEVRDSIAWRDSTIYVPIPLESNQVIVQVGDTSSIETSVAKSEAYVGADGLLHHSLENKREKLPYDIKFPEYHFKSDVKNTKETAHIMYRNVEKPLTWWQKFRIKSFWWLAGCLVLCLVWIFRKPLSLVLKRWLPL